MLYQDTVGITPPRTPPRDYLARAAEKRALQTSKIPLEWRLSPIPPADHVPSALQHIRTCGVLTPEELTITETRDASSLLQRLASGQISSVTVVGAFAKRAALAHQLTTCCTEIFIEEALQEARRLDDVLKSTGKTVGPLHGLPISVKDSVDVKGHDTSVGVYHFRTW